MKCNEHLFRKWNVPFMYHLSTLSRSQRTPQKQEIPDIPQVVSEHRSFANYWLHRLCAFRPSLGIRHPQSNRNTAPHFLSKRSELICSIPVRMPKPNTLPQVAASSFLGHALIKGYDMLTRRNARAFSGQ